MLGAGRGAALLRAALLCLFATTLLALALRSSDPTSFAGAAESVATLAEAARGEASMQQPQGITASSAPQDGWSAVTLPDAWATRWPDHDGVVWYRVRFTLPATAPVAELALFLDAINMAGAAWLDGHPLWRDTSLGEPQLARAWNQSRFVRLGSLERGREHVLLVRVTGYATYAGGIGDIRLGSAQQLQQLQEHTQRWRVGLQQLSLGVNLAIALLFLMLWLCWPRERLYGWFALTAMAWTAHGYNHVATSVWPFSTVPQWQAAMAQLLLLFCCSYVVFVLRFTGRHCRRLELLLLGTFVAAMSASLVGLVWLPSLLAPVGRMSTVMGAMFFVGSVAYVGWQAWVTRAPTTIALAMALLLPLAAGMHDLAVLLFLISGTHYFSLISSTLMLISMAFIMAWRLRSAFEREAHFNQEMREHVNAARQELATALAHQRELEVASARYTERLNIVRDLHDGLGGTLVHAISRWKETPTVPLLPQQALDVMEQIRDDLRLIVESTGHAGDIDFHGLMASLRFHWLPRLQAAGIAVEWHANDLEGLALQGTRALNVLRLLQEALTNVLRHSDARSVRIAIRCEGDTLHFVVEDDGRGFDPQTPGGMGMGLPNMEHRAHALEAMLTLVSTPGIGCRIAGQLSLLASERRSPPNRTAFFTDTPMT